LSPTARVVPQVQEAHGLQEEETPAGDQEATLSPPPPDSAQGQLREGLDAAMMRPGTAHCTTC